MNIIDCKNYRSIDCGILPDDIARKITVDFFKIICSPDFPPNSKLFMESIKSFRLVSKKFYQLYIDVLALKAINKGIDASRLPGFYYIEDRNKYISEKQYEIKKLSTSGWLPICDEFHYVKLTSLSIQDVKITNLMNILSFFPSLKELKLFDVDLIKNYFDDSPQEQPHFKSIQRLKMKNCKLEESDFNINCLPNLESLSVCRPMDWEYSFDLKCHVKLKNLSIKNANLSWFSFYNLTGLENLKLHNNYSDFGHGSVDIARFHKFVKLKKLSLDNCGIENFDGIENLKNINCLRLSSCDMMDFSSLVNLSNLTELDVSYNNPLTLEYFINLENLRALNLANQEITPIEDDEVMENLDKFQNLEFLIFPSRNQWEKNKNTDQNQEFKRTNPFKNEKLPNSKRQKL